MGEQYPRRDISYILRQESGPTATKAARYPAEDQNQPPAATDTAPFRGRAAERMDVEAA